MLGVAVTVLPSTPASVSHGINELQALSLITRAAPAFVSPLPQGNFSWQREGKKEMHIPLVSGDNWAAVITSLAKGCSVMGSAQTLDLSLLVNAEVPTSDPS